MVSPDTHVLVRLIVDDDEAPAQVASARARVADEPAIAIAASVFPETMWVLEHRYRFPRADVAKVATALLQHARFHVAERALLVLAVEILRESNVGFGDALALAHARHARGTLLTFDRRLARLEGAEAP